MKLAAPWSERLEALLPELIEFRRHLHAHPELSGEEHQTAALIAGDLRQAGWRAREGIGRNQSAESHTHRRSRGTPQQRLDGTPQTRVAKK